MGGTIKLLFVIENSAYGGGEKVFTQLIRGLPRGVFEIYCAALPGGRFYEEVKDHCRFLPLDLSNRFDLRNLGRLAAMMREHKIDIAHSQGSRADFYCALAAARAGVRAVATVPMPVEGFDVCFLKKKVYSLLYSLAENKMDRVITVSRTLKDSLTAVHGLPEEKVLLIPNPVDTSELDPACFDAGPAMERYGLRGKLVLGALGRLEWQKNYPCLIEALGVLLKKSPDRRGRLACLIGGAGRLEAELKRRAAEAGLAGEIIFCGQVRSAREFLAAVDIFVMPSLLEGQPLALLEAMSMAKPIAASDIPGINDTVKNGEEALLVPAGDPGALAAAILALAGDPGRAAALGSAARKRAEGYGLAAYISAHEKCYRALTAGGGR